VLSCQLGPSIPEPAGGNIFLVDSGNIGSDYLSCYTYSVYFLKRALVFQAKCLRFKRTICLLLLKLQHWEIVPRNSAYLYSHGTWAAFRIIGQVEASTKFLKILYDPGLTWFYIDPPSLLFELIPLYSMYQLPSSVVRRVSSLPTLRGRIFSPNNIALPPTAVVP